jgi:hypothetical protein
MVIIKKEDFDIGNWLNIIFLARFNSKLDKISLIINSILLLVILKFPQC